MWEKLDSSYTRYNQIRRKGDVKQTGQRLHQRQLWAQEGWCETNRTTSAPETAVTTRGVMWDKQDSGCTRDSCEHKRGDVRQTGQRLHQRQLWAQEWWCETDRTTSAPETAVSTRVVMWDKQDSGCTRDSCEHKRGNVRQDNGCTRDSCDHKSGDVRQTGQRLHQRQLWPQETDRTGAKLDIAVTRWRLMRNKGDNGYTRHSCNHERGDVRYDSCCIRHSCDHKRGDVRHKEQRLHQTLLWP